MSDQTASTASEPSTPRDPLLKVDKLCVSYGDVQVLWDVDLDIYPGEIVALVGSNGAGKTTLLWTLSGLLKPRSGQIFFQDDALIVASSQRLVAVGSYYVPAGR